MIEYFAIKNFLSYRDRTELSFVASKKEGGVLDYAKRPLWYREIDGKRILRMIIGMGLNGAGKSKMIDALMYLRDLATIRPATTDLPVYEPFMLDDESRLEPTELWLSFYMGTQNFYYYIKVSHDRIEEEELKLMEGKGRRIYRRVYNPEAGRTEIAFGNVPDMPRSVMHDLEINTRSNATVLATFGEMNLEGDLLRSVYEYFIKQISKVQRSKLSLAERLMSGDPYNDARMKRLVLHVLHDLGTNIVDYEVDDVPINLVEQLTQMGMNEDMVQNLLKNYMANPESQKKKVLRLVHATETHGRRKLNVELESVGTVNIIRMLVVFFDVVLGQKTTCVDEIEYSLHTTALEFILKSYLELADDSQLFVVTHDLSLLKSSFLRRDAVRMFSKDTEGVTHVSRPDYLHNTTSLYNKYTAEVSGGIRWLMDAEDTFIRYRTAMGLK